MRSSSLFVSGLLLASTAVVIASADAAAAADVAAADAADDAVEEDNDPPTTPVDQKFPECGLYLAVSSTSTAEAPKWGVYAGEKISKHDRVGYGDIAIQTYHLLANMLTTTPTPTQAEVEVEDNLLADIVEFIEQYIWVPQSSGGQFELADDGRIITAIPGTGVLGGYNSKLTNAEWNHSMAYHRPNWGELPGEAHPGRGGSTHFFEVSLSASRNIPAGMEIFVNYGDNWNPDDEEHDEDENSNEVTPDDHTKIDQTLEKIVAFFDKHADELDADSKQEIYQFLMQDVMSAAAGSKKGRKIADMLPESPEGLQDVLRNGGSLGLASSVSHRSLEWLAQHGRCMDNIQPGPSTIPYAGRGALATRTIPNGGLVAPIPLVQIPDKRIMDMYPVMVKLDEEEQEYFVRDSDSDASPDNTQLFVNYCFGHPESKMLFFQAGAATSFINHSPTPNAKLAWSNHPNHHKHWYDLKPKTLIDEGNTHLGLLMEVVAIQEIGEGDEVTIDYGIEWAAAWDVHLLKWDAGVQSGAISSTWPVRALDYNNEHVTKPFSLNDEDHPENLMRKCFLMVKKPTDGEPPINDAGEKVRHWTNTGKTMLSENLFDCALTDVEEIITDDGSKDWRYTIKWTSKTDTTWVKHVPHNAIIFMDKPSTSDQHVGEAFRHWIGIPDDVFPKGRWRNIGGDDDNDDEENDDDEDSDDDEENDKDN